jgi:hypothetical protein
MKNLRKNSFFALTCLVLFGSAQAYAGVKEGGGMPPAPLANVIQEVGTNGSYDEAARARFFEALGSFVSQGQVVVLVQLSEEPYGAPDSRLTLRQTCVEFVNYPAAVEAGKILERLVTRTTSLASASFCLNNRH